MNKAGKTIPSAGEHARVGANETRNVLEDIKEIVDDGITDEEFEQFSAEFLEVLATRMYTPKKLAKMHARGDGAGMRKFLGWYHLVIFKMETVPQHWLVFTANLLMNAAYLTEVNPKARAGLLAKEMGLQGGDSLELRDMAISVTIQQYRNAKMNVTDAKDKTSDRAIEAGFALGYEGVDKIWRSRDKEETSTLADGVPNTDFITHAANQYKRG